MNNSKFSTTTSVELEIRTSAFSDMDVAFFYQSYREGGTTVPDRRFHQTRYAAIEDFVLETRRTSGILDEYVNLDMENLADERVALMRTWLCEIVPSCVYRHRSARLGQTDFYMCCFPDCATPTSSSFALIRHYREQHYTRMPIGIFGTLELFSCSACGVRFKRQQHLNQHIASLNHIRRMAMLGSDTSRRHIAALESARTFAFSLRNDDRAKRFSIEEDLFYSRIPVTVAHNLLAINEPRQQLAIAAPPQSNSQPRAPSPSVVVQPCTSSAAMNDEIEHLSQRTVSQLTIEENERHSSSNDIDSDEQQKDDVTSRQLISSKRKLSLSPVSSLQKVDDDRDDNNDGDGDDDDDDEANDNKLLNSVNLDCFKNKVQSNQSASSSVSSSKVTPLGQIMQSRVENVLATSNSDRHVQKTITDGLFTVIAGARRHSSSSSSSDEPVPKSKRAKTKDDQLGICKMCQEQVRWIVCNGFKNPANKGRHFYKCAHCNWFQWRDLA